MNKESNRIAQNTLSAVEGFVQAQQIVDKVDQEIEQKAKDVLDQANALTEAQNAADNALEPKPFIPPRSMEELFDQADAIVCAANALDEGTMEADARHLRHLEEANDPDEWPLETVVDEKIKEEQKEQEEEDLRNEIVEGLE